jgi:hypothetical protein
MSHYMMAPLLIYSRVTFFLLDKTKLLFIINGPLLTVTTNDEIELLPFLLALNKLASDGL